jgi:hypothetical protein
VQPASELERGVAGGSARRRATRLRERRIADVTAKHKHVGKLMLALTPEPQSTTAWAKGARGEEIFGPSLDALRAEGIAVLHDRRIPGSRANIDHLVVTSAGVFVIDPKNYKGRVEQRGARLVVDGRDRTKLVEGMDRQSAAVRAALASSATWRSVAITPVLVFVSADNWPVVFARSFRFGEVRVVWGKRLGELVRAPGPLDGEAIAAVERLLAAALPSAR